MTEIDAGPLDRRVDGLDRLRDALADLETGLRPEARGEAPPAHDEPGAAPALLHLVDRDQHLVAAARHGRAQADHVRLVTARRGGEVARRHIGAEHDHVVAGLAQEVAHHPQRDGVQLAGRRREHDRVVAARAGDPPSLSLECQGPHGDLGGQVLVGHRDLAPLPQRTDEPQRRRDDLVVDLGRRELGLDRLADHDLGRDLVAGQQGGGVRAGEARDLRPFGGVVLPTVSHLPFTATIPALAERSRVA
jgi:hypothetical protein